MHVCFSPHSATDLSLNPIRAAIDQATSSVFYSVAFLSQMTKGPTIEALFEPQTPHQELGDLFHHLRRRNIVA